MYLRTESVPLTVVGEGLWWQPDPPHLLPRGAVADLDMGEHCSRGEGGLPGGSQSSKAGRMAAGQGSLPGPSCSTGGRSKVKGG